MTLKDILALHDAGIDSDVLENFIRFSVAQNAGPAGLEQPATTPMVNAVPSQSVQPTTTTAQKTIPALQVPPITTAAQPMGPDLNQKLDALTQLIQNSNILNAQQPEPKQLTLEDVMTEIISPRAVAVN